MVGVTARLACVVLSATLSSAGVVPSAMPSAMFVADPITPDSANSARFAIEQEGQRLLSSGAHERAAELYWQKGVELKDPVLIIGSGEAWREHARAQRSIQAAQAAIANTQVALDMLYYLRDSQTSAKWQPVAPEYLPMVIARAEGVITDVNTLIAEIEAEQAAPAEPVEDEGKRKRGPAKPGTGLIAGGSAALVVGLGGAGMGVAGLFMGAAAQADVDDPLVYEPEHSEAQARGRKANVLAGVGLGLAGVGVGVGAALIVLGVKKRRLAGDSSAMLVPMFTAEGAGLSLVGRF